MAKRVVYVTHARSDVEKEAGLPGDTGQGVWGDTNTWQPLPRLQREPISPRAEQAGREAQGQGHGPHSRTGPAV